MKYKLYVFICPFIFVRFYKAIKLYILLDITELINSLIYILCVSIKISIWIRRNGPNFMFHFVESGTWNVFRNLSFIFDLVFTT